MSFAGLLITIGAVLLLLLLGMMVLEAAVKLMVAWRFRDVVDNACQYPDCLTVRRDNERNDT